MEFRITSLDNEFRVKKMNAIEALALKNSIDVDNFSTTVQTFNVILEHIEVKCGDKWLPVREQKKDFAVYFPVGIEDNVQAINELLDSFFSLYFKPLFLKSDASKN